MKPRHLVYIVLTLLLIDQIVKFIIKSNMMLDESITVFPSWFFIRFIENPGAAFGMQLGGSYGKLALSLFRLVAIGALGWYLTRLIKERAPKGILIGFALIFAGAVGNIIDSVFYGVIFSESTFTSLATFMPEGGGYSGWLHGKVVDMLYFPMIDGTLPQWLPLWGGESFTFFSPIFNIADSYITIGVLYMLIFQHKFFK